jgi:hypothetical protein
LTIISVGAILGRDLNRRDNGTTGRGETMKIEFDFQQGMRSLGRMTRRAYDTVKEKAEDATDDTAQADDGGAARTDRGAEPSRKDDAGT